MLLDDVAKRGMCPHIQSYSVAQLGLLQAMKGLPEPIDDTSAVRDMILTLKIRAAALSAKADLTLSDLACVVQDIEFKFSSFANQPVEFRQAPLPVPASVPTFFAEAPQQPVRNPSRGGGKRVFQSEAQRPRQLSDVGSSIPQAHVQDRSPAYDRHDGQPPPQQRRGGGGVRQYEQRPNQQRAREYPVGS